MKWSSQQNIPDEDVAGTLFRRAATLQAFLMFSIFGTDRNIFFEFNVEFLQEGTKHFL